MTLDKTPSDAAILDMWAQFVGDPTQKLPLTDADKVEFARAVLAKWGSPVAAGEPVATIKSWTNGSYWRNYNVTFHRDDLPVGTDLYTTPQPTQAQAGAVDDTALIRQLVEALEHAETTAAYDARGCADLSKCAPAITAARARLKEAP